jgi:hypothetical protein
MAKTLSTAAQIDILVQNILGQEKREKINRTVPHYSHEQNLDTEDYG